MSSPFTYLKMLPHTPSNRGYIINGIKHYGYQKFVDDDKNVVLFSVDDKHIHTWARRGYVEYIKELNEFTDSFHKKLVSSNSMTPCPAELHNSGLCLDKNNLNHLKYYYHFSRYKNNNIVINGDNMVECKYKKDKCWEGHNGLHCNVFYHK